MRVLFTVHEDASVESFFSRFPLSDDDTKWNDDDDDSDDELDDVQEEFLDDDDTSDDESSARNSEESDADDMRTSDSLSVIDDKTEFDSGNEATNVMSSTFSPLPPEMKNDLYSLLCHIDKLLGGVRTLLEFIRKSSLIYISVRDKMASADEAKELVLDVRVRWNSTWLML